MIRRNQRYTHRLSEAARLVRDHRALAHLHPVASLVVQELLPCDYRDVNDDDDCGFRKTGVLRIKPVTRKTWPGSRISGARNWTTPVEPYYDVSALEERLSAVYGVTCGVCGSVDQRMNLREWEELPVCNGCRHKISGFGRRKYAAMGSLGYIAWLTGKMCDPDWKDAFFKRSREIRRNALEAGWSLFFDKNPDRSALSVRKRERGRLKDKLRGELRRSRIGVVSNG